MKQKNPLYLVKGKTVHPAQGIWDYVVLKFNLRPLLNVLQQLLHYVLEQVRDYPSLVLAQNFINRIIQAFQRLKVQLGY